MGENGVLGGGGMGPADTAAVMRGAMNYGYNDGWSGGNCWWIVILFLAMMWGGNGFFGNNNGFQNAIGYENLATSNEVQRGFDNQNSMANERDILASVNSNSLRGMQNSNMNSQYITGMIQDKYGELNRDINGLAMMQQQAMNNQNDCCCSTKMLIQDNTAATNAAIAQNRYEAAMNMANLNAGLAQNRYDAAMNTAEIKQIVQQEGAATRELMQANKIEALQQKIQGLELQNAVAGVVRYPMSTAYNAGYNPFCNCGNGCCGQM